MQQEMTPNALWKIEYDRKPLCIFVYLLTNTKQKQSEQQTSSHLQYFKVKYYYCRRNHRTNILVVDD